MERNEVGFLKIFHFLGLWTHLVDLSLSKDPQGISAWCYNFLLFILFKCVSHEKYIDDYVAEN